MQGIKIGSVHQSLWHGILVCLIVFYPFLAWAEDHNTQSELQETTDQENQSLPQVTRQDIHRIIDPLIRNQNTLTTNTTTLIETQKVLKTRTTIYMVISGILLLAILSAFIWLFLRYRNLAAELGDIRKWIGTFSNVNSGLKRDLSDISSRIRKLAKTSDMEKLATENQNSIQEILNLFELIVDKTTNETPAPCKEKVDTSEQIAEDTSDLELTPAIADLCEHYNAGIQDRNRRNDFLHRYHDSYKIRVENAADRRVKGQMDPVFKTHHADGNFLGCYVEEERSYAVVPAYQLQIVHAILHYGAFVDVFECDGLEFDDQDTSYEVVKIIKPAIFEPDEVKEIWTLRSEGILELKEV